MQHLYLLAAIAAGVSVIAAVIAFADLPYRLKDGTRITLVGQVI